MKQERQHILLAVFAPNLIDQLKSAHLTSPANICVSLFFLCRGYGFDKFLHTEEHVLVNDRFLCIPCSKPFVFQLTYFLLALERERRLFVMYAVSYVDFVFQYRLELCCHPCVTLALRRICEDMRECSVLLERGI